MVLQLQSHRHSLNFFSTIIVQAYVIIYYHYPVGKVLPMMTYKVRLRPKAVEGYLWQA